MTTDPRVRVALANADNLTPLLERIATFLEQHGAAIDAWTRHHPVPLPIDGREYHRRRNHRRNRR